jgi:hypothetical protein
LGQDGARETGVDRNSHREDAKSAKGKSFEKPILSPPRREEGEGEPMTELALDAFLFALLAPSR